MSDDWARTTLGDIATLYMGRTPSRNNSEYWTTELKYPFCTIADMEGASISPSREGVTERAINDGKARVAPAGSLLMSFKLTIGRVGFAERDLYPNEAIVVINPDEKKATRKFLYYQLGSMDLTGNSGRAVKGSTLNSSSLAGISISIPPLTVQQRIVDLMSSVDSYIAALQQQADAARSARSSVLSELLSAGGDDWTETTLGDVADVKMGQSPPGDTYNAEGIGIPFMQGSAEFGEHYPEPVKFCSAPAKIAEIGDLLLSVRAPVGDSNFANQRIAIGRGLAAVCAKRGADTCFLRLVIQLNTAGLLAASGTGMFSSITGKNLREFAVNLPPIAEQTRIVAVISSMDEVIQSADEAVTDAKNLRSGLLSDFLSGAHEIPESYDQLLGAA